MYLDKAEYDTLPHIGICISHQDAECVGQEEEVLHQH